jgi:TolB-like protein
MKSMKGMKSAVMAAVLLAVTAGLGWGQRQAVVVAVFPFEARSGTSSDDANTVTEVFNIKLQATGALRTVGRNVIDKVMKQEHIYQMSDFSGDEKTAQLRKGLNADWVVYGVVSKLGATFVITATLIDLNTSETMGGVPIQMNSIEEAFSKMDAPIAEMVQRLTRVGAVAAIPASAALGQALLKDIPEGSRVAVLNIASNDSAERTFLIDELTMLFVNARKKFVVIDRWDIDTVMFKEMSFNPSENIDDRSAINIGKMFDATVVVTGSVNGSDGRKRLVLKALDVRTAATLAMSSSDLAPSAQGAPSQAGTPAPVAKEYKVGDIGPAGGRVFYDKGRMVNGWRYLEAAPSETEFTARWGAYKETVGGTEKGVGTGKRNTELIVAYLKRTGESGKAAQICDSLVFKGYDDWFLPSWDELNLIYANLKAKGLGELSNDIYWSSSEAGSDYAADQVFGNGRRARDGKIQRIMVRAVRAF